MTEKVTRSSRHDFSIILPMSEKAVKVIAALKAQYEDAVKDLRTAPSWGSNQVFDDPVFMAEVKALEPEAKKRIRKAAKLQDDPLLAVHAGPVGHITFTYVQFKKTFH